MRKLTQKSKAILLTMTAALALTGCQAGSDSSSHATTSKTYFDIAADGSLERPVDYRSWVYVGTPLTPNDMNNGKAAFQEFHNVYIDPESYAHYKTTGEWREGTILMKELVSVGSKGAVSGNGYFMGEFIGLEATIKSSKHFPNEPGNWAYYSFTNHDTGVLTATAKPFAAESCNSCHENSAADDFVFTQYYPVLTAAKGFGAGTPENGSRRTALKKPHSAVAEAAPVDPTWAATALTPSDETFDVPVELDSLFAYLKDGTYRSFAAQETENHASIGPHPNFGKPVRVYYNDTIAGSVRKGNKEHPKGSAIVKEMFTDDNVLSGWAVMVKTGESTDEGKSWFWYEGTNVSDKTEIAAIGNGVPGCQSCHTSGLDMVKSNLSIIK